MWGNSSWGNYYQDRVEEDRIKFGRLEERLSSAVPEERRSIRREYYRSKRYTSVDQMTAWSNDASPELNVPGDPSMWAPSMVFPVDRSLNSKVYCIQGDITSIEVDAIVNAANNSLLGGGGVDGAIHSAAGRLLEEECRRLRGCEDGDAKITKGYFLPADYVIHTVGPFGSSHHGDAVLQSCYRRSLDVLKENGLRSVAFCGISTGIYGFPLVRATHIALRTVREWLAANPDAIDAVVFCQFLDKECIVYKKLLSAYFPKETNELNTTVDTEGVNTTVDTEGVNTTVGTEGVNTTVGTEGVSTTVDTEGVSTTVGTEGVNTTVGTEGVNTTVDTEGVSTTVDTEGVSTTVDTEGVSTTVDTEGVNTAALTTTAIEPVL